VGVQVPEFHTFQEGVIPGDPPVARVGGNGVANNPARTYLA